MKEYIFYIILLIIVIIVIYGIKYLINKNKIYENNTNKIDINNNVINILQKKYDSSSNGLIFRGLENCNDFINDLSNCVRLEIDGPHEVVHSNNISKDQGATTWLSSGMNPYFYPDTGNTVPYNVLLIFDGNLNNDNSGCMYIQDANTNGCVPSDINCKSNDEIAQNYYNSYISNPSNPKGILCSFNSKKVMYEQYNKYNKLLAEYNYNDNNVSKLQFKENQKSSFWTKKDLVDINELSENSTGLLAIGYLYSTDTVDNINSVYGSKKIAEMLQKKIQEMYNKKIPVVQIYRELKTNCDDLPNKDCGNNKYKWHKQFNNLVFKENIKFTNKFCNKNITGVPCDDKTDCTAQLSEIDNCSLEGICQNNYCKYYEGTYGKINKNLKCNDNQRIIKNDNKDISINLYFN